MKLGDGEDESYSENAIKKTKTSKTKNIEKPQKQKKQKNKKTTKQHVKQDQNTKKEDKVKKGRPPQTDRIDVTEDPTSNIQQKILDYLDKIGLKHGLVFRNQDRQKLKIQNNKRDSHQLKITWKQDHEWQRNEQIMKIQKIDQIRGVLQSYAALDRGLTFQNLQQIFLNIGDIAADECTLQIYRVLALALKLNISVYSQQQTDEQINNLFKSMIFLPGQFTKLKIQYWIQIIEDKNKIKQYFYQMIKDIKQQFEIVLKQPNKLTQYIQEQREMDEKLQQIIQRCQKSKQK